MMNAKRAKTLHLKTTQHIHNAVPSTEEGEHSTRTRCGKKTSSLYQCCVYSAEAASCPVCIKEDLKAPKIVRKPRDEDERYENHE